jgi:hypothetical protein
MNQSEDSLPYVTVLEFGIDCTENRLLVRTKLELIRQEEEPINHNKLWNVFYSDLQPPSPDKRLFVT